MQHETDHLEGTLFTDRLTDESRREVMRQLREQELTRSRIGRLRRNGE